MEGESDSLPSEQGSFWFQAALELHVAQPNKPPVFSAHSKPSVRQQSHHYRHYQCQFGGPLDSVAPSTLISSWGHVIYAF